MLRSPLKPIIQIRERIPPRRAGEALEDLGDLPIDLFPSLELRYGAWRHRHNLKIGDALFLELARVLGEPLVTKDGGLAATARAHGVPVVKLGV
jgi:predicted nucleic acid-binding protein